MKKGNQILLYLLQTYFAKRLNPFQYLVIQYGLSFVNLYLHKHNNYHHCHDYLPHRHSFHHNHFSSELTLITKNLAVAATFRTGRSRGPMFQPRQPLTLITLPHNNSVIIVIIIFQRCMKGP